MKTMEFTAPQAERAVLVGIYSDRVHRAREMEALQELRALTHSARAQTVATFLQEKLQPDPAYFVGTGKLAEIRDCALNRGANLVIFDEDLSPAQLRNLEKFLEIKVIDRSELILDIFAQRARSREGKLQVELAQLEYLLPRLMGRGTTLSRLGGGIGTRGPGETKLEVDRRSIRVRLSRIKKELKKLGRRRALQRLKRQRVPIPTVSLVGYTNAGKTTLFNRLSGEKMFVSSSMFATLDPLVRKITIGSGQEILISDTVGFIRKLPHTLVTAFHATLEEALQADLILHVIDSSHPDYPILRQVVYEVLEEIGLSQVPILETYNKCDLMIQRPQLNDSRTQVIVSAVTGQGIPKLLDRLAFLINQNLEKVNLSIPFEHGEVVSELRARGCVESQKYEKDGIHLRALLPLADLGRYRQFIKNSSYV